MRSFLFKIDIFKGSLDEVSKSNQRTSSGEGINDSPSQSLGESGAAFSLAKSVLLGRPTNQSVVHGDNVVLECLTKNANLYKTTWKRIRPPGMIIPREKSRMLEGNLLLDGVGHLDAGEYVCVSIR